MAALLTMLLAMCGACSSEEEEILAAAEEVESTDSLMTVTFQTGVPVDSDAVQTRAAIDGSYADVLYYILYNGEGTKIIDTNVGGTPIAVRSNKTAAVEFRVNPGKTYHVVFWAQSSQVTAYTLNASTGIMTIDYSVIPVNDAHYDAFFYTGEFTPHRGTPIETVYLRRPFQFTRAGVRTVDITSGKCPEPYEATMLHDAYTKLNLWTGRATDMESVVFKYNYVANDYYTTISDANGYPYTFVAFAFVLADTEDVESCKADFAYFDEDDTFFQAGLKRTDVGYINSMLKRNRLVTLRYYTYTY